jgi:hypothetical protein
MKHVLVLLALVGAACGERGSGDYAFESRELPLFSKIENRSEVNLYIAVEADAVGGEVTVTGDDNLIDLVTTEVANDRLVVRTLYNVWPLHELRLIATVPSLKRCSNQGSGDSHITGISSESFTLIVGGSGNASVDGDFTELEVRSDGSGNAELSGGAQQVLVNATGSGNVRARELPVRDAEVSVSGSGDVELCVTGTLDAHSSGSGDIDYHCDPAVVHPSTAGSGDITGH